MNVDHIKLRLLVLFAFLFSFSAKGQNLRFIYIQTENKQPFYVKMDKKYLSSSETGYIIIAKLIEGSYQLTIGSPKNEFAEQHVTLSVKDMNTGYLLKKSSVKSWTLVNLQTTALITAEKQAAEDKEEELVSVTDEFAKVLAAVVNDSSIAKNVITKKSPETVIATETVVKKSITPVVNEEIVKSEAQQVKTQNSQIIKLLHDTTSGGLLYTYLDKNDSENDTVKIFLPVLKSNTITQKENESSVKKDSRFIDMELPNPNAKADSAVSGDTELVITEKKAGVDTSIAEKSALKSTVTDTNKITINTRCKKTATQNDFLQLRRQMAGEDNERNMTKTAAKQFLILCFTTEQVRNLGLMYVTEDERYKFFVAAFQHVSDVENFALLEQQLADIYYKTRFKAMLNH